MSMIQIVCITILSILFLSANIACAVVVRREDDGAIPVLLFSFTLIMDSVALVMLVLGATGGLE